MYIYIDMYTYVHIWYSCIWIHQHMNVCKFGGCKEFHQHSFIETPTWFCHVLPDESQDGQKVDLHMETWEKTMRKKRWPGVWAKLSIRFFCFSCGFLGVELIEHSALMRICLVARLNQATMRFRCDDLQMHFRYLTKGCRTVVLAF